MFKKSSVTPVQVSPSLSLCYRRYLCHQGEVTEDSSVPQVKAGLQYTFHKVCCVFMEMMVAEYKLHY